MPRNFTLTPTRTEVLGRLAEHGKAENIMQLGRMAMGPAKVVTTLHELRKTGMVSFIESEGSGDARGKSGHHQSIKRIEITARGLEAVEASKAGKPDMPAIKAPVNVLANDARHTAEIDPDNQVAWHKEGDVGEDKLMGVYLESQHLVDTLDRTQLGPRRKPRSTPDELRAAEQERFLAELAAVEAEESAALAVESPIQTVPESTVAVVTWPLLEALRDRSNKVQAAAALLEAAGLLEAAVAALDALVVTPAEAEYLAFAESCGK